MTQRDLAQMRTDYTQAGLDEASAGDDPVALFERWLDQAIEAQLDEPNAMALATADHSGAPSVRIVLLKSFDRDGAVFFTNLESRKGREIADNDRVSAVMLWHPMQRQVRLEGRVEAIAADESDEYYLSRPEGSRISATASRQSQVVSGRDELQERWEQAQVDGAAERRPDYWGGLRIRPEVFEFWQGRPSRLHDRIRFRLTDDGWQRDRLAP